MLQSANTINELGMCTSCFGHRDALTPAKLAQLDHSGIPWCEIAGLQDQHFSVFDLERLHEITAALAQLKLRMWSFHAPFCALSMDDPETRAAGIRRLVQSAKVAKELGARIVVVHPGRDVRSIDRERELRWLSDGLAQAAEKIPEGIQLALETMGIKAVCGPADEILSVIDRHKGAPIGICFDSGHVNQADDIYAYLQTIANRVITVHLHDNNGDRDAHAIPGAGNIDWPRCLAALRTAGYTGPWMCEAGPYELTLADFFQTFQDRMHRYLAV